MKDANNKDIIDKKHWSKPEIVCLDVKETKGGLEDNVVEDFDIDPDGSIPA